MKLGRTDFNTVLVWAIVIGLIAAVAYQFYSINGSTESHDTEVKEKKAVMESQSQITEAIGKLVTKHNAATGWDKGSLEYTIEVEEALIRSDGRPVLMIGWIRDVVKKSGKHSVYFIKWEPSDISWLLGTPNLYVVVAHISEVEKVKFTLNSDSEQV